MNHHLLAVCLLSCPFLVAQTQTERGPFSGLAQGLVVSGVGEVLHKPVGDQSDPPTPFTVPTDPDTPDYRLAALFGAHAPSIRMDAMSTGNDLLPIVQIGSQGEEAFVIQQFAAYWSWASLMMSVASDGADGADPASVLGRRGAELNGDVGAELFNYWFLGNDVLPDEMNDTAYFVAGREEMGLAPNQNIEAFDAYMPAVVAASQGGEGGFVGYVDRWYFSLTPAACEYIRDHWLGDMDEAFEMAKDDVRPATVFKTSWNASTQSWRKITAEFLPIELGLTEEDDIDALAFSAAPNFDQFAVFSLPVDPLQPNRSQVLAGGGGVNGPLLVNDDPTPTRRPQEPVGVPNNRNVDAICGFDPENVFCPWIGSPVSAGSHLPYPYGRFGISAERFRLPNGDVRLGLQATGLPAVRGAVQFHLSIGRTRRSLPLIGNVGQPTVYETVALPLAGSDVPVLIWATFTDGGIGEGQSWALRVNL